MDKAICILKGALEGSTQVPVLAVQPYRVRIYESFRIAWSDADTPHTPKSRGLN